MPWGFLNMPDQPGQRVGRVSPPEFRGKTLIGNHSIAVGTVVVKTDRIVAVAVVSQNVLPQTSGEIPDSGPIPGAVKIDAELLRMVFPPIQRGVEFDAGEIAHPRSQRGYRGQHPVCFGIVELSVSDPA